MFTTLIDCRSLQAALGRPDWVIIDARYNLSDKPAGRRAYCAGHIPGAVYVDLETDLSGPTGPTTGRHPLPDAGSMRALFSRLGVGPDVQVVVYDDASGGIAARLWWMLRFMCHDGVAVLDGGWQEWNRLGLDTESVERQSSPTTFHGESRESWQVTAAAIPAVARLIDSREPGRYRGESEPIDPVAGHIPGAVNYCWKRNLDQSGCFRTAAAIRHDMLELLAGTPAAEAAFYCGSGVTACHNILAAAYAGLPLPRLYVGSWSEWCRMPGQPVATGEQA